MKKKLFWVVFSIFLGFSVCYADEEITTINIINALKTDYEKNADTGNENIILEGAVELSVEKGNTKTKITANKVSYDRKTKMLYAEGDVHVISTGSDAGDENISASSLILNTSTLEGVFDDGRVIQTQSDAINLPSGSTLVVFSDLFGKSSENTLAFKKANLTFCDDDDPHWRIKASRLWLLPGGEFAFLNGLLYVGPVPVLYLPAFYYPKDELIFNPTFGYRNREGFFIQTTTYVYGRKPLNSSSSLSSSGSNDKAADETLESLYNFMKPSTLKEQVHEGLMLHNLDTNYTGSTSEYVKLITDWYSNVGFITGVDSNLRPSKVPISKLSMGLLIAFSNTLYKENSTYTNVFSSGNKYWDRSNFLGLELPFRYKANFQFELSKPVRIALSMPIYSDPFFDIDFGTRSEDLNWISTIKELLETNRKESNEKTVSSYAWTLTTGYTAELPSFMKPYISTLSVSTTSSIGMSLKQATDANLRQMFEDRYGSISTADVNNMVVTSPEREFFYPSQVTPVSANVTISGTLYEWPGAKKSSSKNDEVNFAVPLNIPDDLKTSLKTTEPSDEVAENTETSEDDEEDETDIFTEFVSLPSLGAGSKQIVSLPGIEYKLGYSINPNISTQLTYSSASLYTAGDFKWDDPRTFMYVFKMPVSLKSDFSYGASFFSLRNSINYSPIWQGHPYIKSGDNGGYSESEIKSLKKTDYSVSTQTITNENSISFKPFIYNSVLKDTGISWNTNFRLFHHKFLADSDVDNPVWQDIWFDWGNKETVLSNSLNFNLSTTELGGKLKQNLTFSVTLPPLDERYGFGLNLSFPYVTLNFGFGIYKRSKTSSAPEKWVKNPLQQSLSFSIPLLGKNLTLSESFNYNVEDEPSHPDSFKTSLSWYGISFAYTMNYDLGYDFVERTGWVPRTKKEFLPYSLSLSYTLPSKTFFKWKNRIEFSPGLSTAVVVDLIKSTNSYFVFSPSLTFKLNKLLELKFSATTRNSSIATYFDSRILGHTKNIFEDLFNSFRFDNEALRRASGFKLKSFNIDITHSLHDWKLDFAFKIEPKIVTRIVGGTEQKSYIFDPYIAVSVSWSPMGAIKTSVVHDFESSRIEYDSNGNKKGTGYYVWELD